MSISPGSHTNSEWKLELKSKYGRIVSKRMYFKAYADVKFSLNVWCWLHSFFQINYSQQKQFPKQNYQELYWQWNDDLCIVYFNTMKFYVKINSRLKSKTNLCKFSTKLISFWSIGLQQFKICFTLFSKSFDVNFEMEDKR